MSVDVGDIVLGRVLGADVAAELASGGVVVRTVAPVSAASVVSGADAGGELAPGDAVVGTVAPVSAVSVVSGADVADMLAP